MVIKSFLKSLWKQLFYLGEHGGLHIYPVHYYSQLPDTRDLRRRRPQWSGRKEFPGLDINVDNWVTFLKMVTSSCRDEHESFDSYENEVRNFGWGGYGPVEAFVYYCVIRHFQPQRIIEVGSGISAVYSLRALEANGGGAVIAVEPYPCDGLRKLVSEDSRLMLWEYIVQEVELDRFTALKEGDILFIDSTHTVKIGGDVNFLILDVLPRLAKGVVVTLHDIPWPQRCLNPFKDNMFWQEPELLQAFLAFNRDFKILMAQKWIHMDYPGVFQDAFTWYNPQIHSPSSLYLQRVSD